MISYKFFDISIQYIFTKKGFIYWNAFNIFE